MEGDVGSSLALLNAYLVACCYESAKKLKKVAKEAKKYDGNLFNTGKVQNYMMKALISHCKQCLESLFTKFQINSNPIISVPDMKTFIEQAPAISGNTWEFLCDLHASRPIKLQRRKIMFSL